MNTEDKRLEKFVDQIMQGQALEQPSLDFESKVFSKINTPINSKVFVYKPLISKRAWLVILLVAVGLVANIYFGASTGNATIFDDLALPKLEFNVLESLNFNWSKSLIYAAITLLAMVGLQVPLLKIYHDRYLKI